MENEDKNCQQFGTPKQNELEEDEPEIREEISTLTFEYEIAYYTKDHTLIYQFKMKEDSKKETKVNQERNEDEEDEQNELMELSLKLSSIPNMTQTLSQHVKSQDNYLPISYMMEYVCDDR